jgi:hypothetical protein
VQDAVGNVVALGTDFIFEIVQQPCGAKGKGEFVTNARRLLNSSSLHATTGNMFAQYSDCISQNRLVVRGISEVRTLFLGG